jgi:hypothetical protein
LFHLGVTKFEESKKTTGIAPALAVEESSGVLGADSSSNAVTTAAAQQQYSMNRPIDA